MLKSFQSNCLDVLSGNLFCLVLGNLLHFQSEHNIFNYGSPWEKCILLKYNSSFYSGSLNGFAVQVYVSAGRL